MSNAINSRLAIGTTDKNVSWWNPTLPDLTGTQRDLFENYSHIAHEDVIPHISEIREKAWSFNPLPMFGTGRFIITNLCTFASYPHILRVLQNGGKLLDLGCCFGQEIRKLVHDGAPASSLYGGELRKEFVDMGYDLFLDRDILGAKFIIGDIFDSRAWVEVEGQLSVVHMGLFLHLFDWNEQKRICERVVGFLKQEKGVLVLGHQMGSTKPKDVPFGTEKVVFRHDEKTFQRLWDEVGKSTNSQWIVKDTKMDEVFGKRPWDDEYTRRLVFEVERVT